MSDKQNKPTLLVDQDEALGFYLDSLLSTHELQEESEAEEIQADTSTIDAHAVKQTSVQEDKETSQKQIEEARDSETEADKLQRAKDFLRASKQRQQSHQTAPEISESSLQADQVTRHSDEGKVLQATGPGKPSLTETVTETVSKAATNVITKGPVSPKPREAGEPEVTRKPAAGTSIVFSKTDKKGDVSEQVLIPRSQRLAASSQSELGPAKVAAKAMTAKNDLQTSRNSVAQTQATTNVAAPQAEEIQTSSQAEQSFQSLQPEKSSQREKSLQPQPGLPSENGLPSEPDSQAVMSPQAEEAKESQAAKEAPNLDLSLFLPKIKTLSEEEIAQQIEALTQAAVSQAQLETDLAQVSQLEQRKHQLVESQTEKDSEALIRNIDNAPAWAVPDFQVLLFAVAGLKLAVPLTELNGIVEWGDEYITEMPGHAPWYLGLIQNQGKNVPVIDTLQQVVPKNRWPNGYLEQRQFKHIILIDNGRWGLACEKVLEVITLKTDSVKWRSSRTKRRWLLGTVIEHMCALLDSAEFATMLKTGEDSLNG